MGSTNGIGTGARVFPGGATGLASVHAATGLANNGVPTVGGDVLVLGGGIRVTGVVIGARATVGEGICVKFPEGGGILVTGVETLGVIGGPGRLIFGTGGIGAAD